MTVRCLSCNNPVTAAEQREGWCENCGKRFPSVVTATPARVSSPEATAAPVGPAVYRDVARPGGSNVLGWGTVRAGLAQAGVGAILAVLGLALTHMGTTGKKIDEIQTGKVILESVGSLMLLIGIILAVGGMCMGCAAPSDPGPRGWAAGIAGCVGVVVLLTILQPIFQAENRRALQEHFKRRQEQRFRSFEDFNARSKPQEEFKEPYGEGTFKALRYGLEGFGWLGLGLFVLFLRGVAQFFHDETLAAHSLVYLLVLIVVASGLIGFRVVAANSSSPPADPETFGWIRVGLLSVMAVWLAIVLRGSRQTVARGIVG